MLLELKVQGLAVIDQLEVSFLRPGLNIITGETGAGKSVLMKALSLILGGKVSPDLIRSGKDQASIEASLDLSGRHDIKNALEEADLHASEDDALVIRRVFNRMGKHRVYINGHLATLQTLESLTSPLIEITGQHEHHSLIKPSAQLNILDRFADLWFIREEFQNHFYAWQKLEEELAVLENSRRERELRLDFLEFQINELENFNLRAGEEDELNAQYNRAKNHQKLMLFAQKAEETLYSGESSIQSVLGDLAKDASSAATVDPKLESVQKAVQEMAAIAGDVAHDLRDYLKVETLDESELDQIEERLSQLRKLLKKYGPKETDVIQSLVAAKTEFQRLKNLDENLLSVQERIDAESARLNQLARALHERRAAASIQLGQGVNKQIADLNMKGISFTVAVDEAKSVNVTGMDEVQFCIQTSSKDVPKPLHRVASGGELSRLMLALKQVVADSDAPMTYLFDEVDTGISGPTAEKVGRKLKNIAKTHQVICVTHLPQIAAHADAHFLISKEEKKGFVSSRILELNEEKRTGELARLISGEKITKTSLAHAKTMIAETRI